jgi:hypothetical protein
MYWQVVKSEFRTADAPACPLEAPFPRWIPNKPWVDCNVTDLEKGCAGEI